MSEDWFEVLDVQIWGGSGSVAANTEDLQRAARLQERAQEYLAQAESWVLQAEKAIEEEWILAHLAQGHEMVSNSLVPFTSLEFPTPEHVGIKNQIVTQIDYVMNFVGNLLAHRYCAEGTRRFYGAGSCLNPGTRGFWNSIRRQYLWGSAGAIQREFLQQERWNGSRHRI